MKEKSFIFKASKKQNGTSTNVQKRKTLLMFASGKLCIVFRVRGSRTLTTAQRNNDSGKASCISRETC